MQRCQWASAAGLEQQYHDQEWGVPVHDDRLLFEFLILEGAQAGLSWSTILAKRVGYRKVFDFFMAEKIARYSDHKAQQLLQDRRIIRNRLKINATVTNARAFLKIQRQYGSFDRYIWSFTDGDVVQNRWSHIDHIPASTPESAAMSKDLKQKGFKFVGPTICYAYMQAVGMVNDHTTDCFRHSEIEQLSK
jgi:DNA-3-methyladenine glycosylase I